MDRLTTIKSVIAGLFPVYLPHISWKKLLLSASEDMLTCLDSRSNACSNSRHEFHIPYFTSTGNSPAFLPWTAVMPANFGMDIAKLASGELYMLRKSDRFLETPFDGGRREETTLPVPLFIRQDSLIYEGNDYD